MNLPPGRAIADGDGCRSHRALIVCQARVVHSLHSYQRCIRDHDLFFLDREQLGGEEAQVGHQALGVADRDIVIDPEGSRVDDYQPAHHLVDEAG